MSRLAVLAFSLTMVLSALGGSPGYAQKATAVATGKADLSGDGRIDELRLDELGNITAHITGQGKADAWTTLQAQGKVVDGSIEVAPERDAKDRIIVVVKAILRSPQSKRREEGLVLAYRAGSFDEIWRGPLGLAGSDGATTISLDLSPYGVIKYVNRHGVIRCDEETAHLEAERLDVKRGAFRPARQAVRVPADAPRVTSSNKAPAAISADARGILFRPEGASSSARAASSADLVAPLEVADGDSKTAWIENTPGSGRGEFVTFKASVGEVGVKLLRLQLGHAGAYNDYDRPKRLGLALGKGKHYWIDIPADPRAEQWVELPTAVKSACVTLIVDEVYPGRKHKGQTAISEVSILSEEELSPAGSARLLARQIASGGANADIDRLLHSMGATAAPEFEAAIAATDDPRARLRLRLALARIPASPGELVQALLEPSITDDQKELVSGALLALDAEGLKATLDAMQAERLSGEDYRRLADLLARHPGDEAARGLLVALQDGSETRRAMAASALAKRDAVTPMLIAALASDPPPPEPAGLYRTLGLAGAELPPLSPERDQVVQALLKEFERSGLSYESRYRLIQAAQAVGGPALGIQLLGQVQGLEDAETPEELALLRLTLEALGSMQPFDGEPALGASVHEVMGTSLGHKDPGVRLAVLSSVSGAPWAQAPVAERLRLDQWPQVRRSAAAALAAGCAVNPAGARALEQSARGDADTAVAQTALAGLIGCGAPDLLAVLIDLVNDSKRPGDVRLQAARAMGESASGPAQATLVRKEFSNARRKALADKASGKIAAAMTAALADLGQPQDVELLEAAASDPAFPELQAAAINALGQLCAPRSLPLLRKLGNSHEHTVSSAARRATRQCR